MKETVMNTLSKLVLFSLLLLSSTAHAIPVTQFLNDSIGRPTEDNWKPIDASVNYFVEDDSYDGSRHSLDAEAIYVKHDATYFYIAVIASLSSENNRDLNGNLWFDFGSNGRYDYKFGYGDDDERNNDLDWVNISYKPGHDDERHYLMGTKIANSAFEDEDLNKKLSIRWIQDSERDSVSINLPSNVPTPDTLPMLGLGLMMFLGYRRFSNASARTVLF
jgi:hypothetical protein